MSCSIDAEAQSVQGLQRKKGKEDQTQVSAWSSSSSVTDQFQAVELLPEDNESISNSSPEPLPAYERTPLAVHINREGFRAHATASCELEFLFSLVRLVLHTYVLSRRWTRRNQHRLQCTKIFKTPCTSLGKGTSGRY